MLKHILFSFLFLSSNLVASSLDDRSLERSYEIGPIPYPPVAQSETARLTLQEAPTRIMWDFKIKDEREMYILLGMVDISVTARQRVIIDDQARSIKFSIIPSLPHSAYVCELSIDDGWKEIDIYIPITDFTKLIQMKPVPETQTILETFNTMLTVDRIRTYASISESEQLHEQEREYEQLTFQLMGELGKRVPGSQDSSSECGAGEDSDESEPVAAKTTSKPADPTEDSATTSQTSSTAASSQEDSLMTDDALSALIARMHAIASREVEITDETRPLYEIIHSALIYLANPETMRTWRARFEATVPIGLV